MEKILNFGRIYGWRIIKTLFGGEILKEFGEQMSGGMNSKILFGN